MPSLNTGSVLQIPGYRIEQLIGSGAMASVHLALQESLERRVALKIMAAGLAADTSFCKRFLKEGRIIAQLSHPHIITIYDIGVFQDHYYMAMEYLGGGNLKERLNDGLPLEQALLILEQIAKPLGYAHQHGFIHRDVKPANILFRVDNSAVLSDFGIAKGLSDNTQLTAMGWTLGTPNYMSPEQALGKAVDARSDLYSLGVVFFEMLTGSRPFQSQDSFRTAMMHVQEPIPRLPKPVAMCQDLVDRLMAKNPDDRFADADAVLDAIAQLRSPQKSSRPAKNQRAGGKVAVTGRQSARARHLRPILAVAIGCAAIAGLVWYFLLPLIFPSDLSPSGSLQPQASVSSPPPATVPDDCPELDTPTQDQIAGLMRTAKAHEEAGFLFYAADVYHRVLEIDPCHVQANAKLDYIANRYEEMARDSLAKNDRATSLELVETGLQVLPDHRGLQALQEELGR